MATDNGILLPQLQQISDPKYLKYIDQPYGKLRIVACYRQRSSGGYLCTFADCQCECGNRFTTRLGALKNHRTQSCGCGRLTLKALEGQHFGHLLVLRIYRKGKITYAECQCDCGTICHKSAYQIQKEKWSGTHCGCQKKGPKYPHYLLDGITVKDCADCGLPTPLSRFATHKERWDGLDGFCSTCATTRTTQWQQQHPDLARANGARNSARRRARKRNLPAAFTPEQEAFTRSYWEQRCAICGREEGLWYTIALDHWQPLSKPDSLGTTATNMLPVCHNRKGSSNAVEQSCNTTKNAKDPISWLISKLGKQKAKAKLRQIETFFAAARAFEESRALAS